jgi:branched-chain amino acid transport system substrate-binding protein
VAANIAYNPTAPDLGNVVLRCQESNPDVWIETGYVSDTNLLLRTAQQQNFKPSATMTVGTGDNRLTLDAVGPDLLQGVFSVAYPHFDMKADYAPGAAEFLKSYQDKNGSDPTFPQTLTAYSGMQMLFDAVEEAGDTDPAKVRAAISSWDKPQGTYANGFGATFDDTFQNTSALPTVVQWQDGATVTVYPQDAAADGAQVIGANG